jgi:hypothetical protein
MALRPRLINFCGLALFACAQSPAQTTRVSFAQDVAPILAKQCTQCHGQSPVMGNLDLRSRESALKGGQHGPAIIPGDAANSLLYRHVTGQQKPQMPMGGQLTDRQIAVLKNWIDGGAEWESAVTVQAAATTHQFTEQQRNFWAFQPVSKPVPPRVEAPNPIDAFVLAKLEANKLKPNPPAERITLIRRAYLDLIGLPPSPEEVEAFLSDKSPAAFEKVVDKLLASAQYGERWGRHWLDLARYADSAGFKADETRPNLWRYRDYVIRSFNEDKPYDRFVKEQIAGDELYPNDPEAKIATGFNRLWPDESNLANPILRRQEILNDITDVTGSVFMGMTYGCARCHDHKFDPILQKDYYRLQAFFANIRNDDRTSLLSGQSAIDYRQQRAEWENQTREIRAKMEEIIAKARVDKTREGIGMFPKEAQDAIFTPAEQRTPMQWQMYYRSASRLPTDAALAAGLKGEAKQRYADLRTELAKFDHLKPPDAPVAETMLDASRNAPPTYILSKGIWDAPEDEVQPGFLSILDENPAKIVAPEGSNTTGRRTVLANWLADPKNPLTARVLVNRIWQYHFGTGIAGTSSDFGMMGERPSNPQLLDYLAATFVEDGWSIKRLHRRIMLSNVYQESSASQTQAAQIDPDNKLMWRFERRRMEGEAIRDSMLFVSGLLNPKMGGPGVFPPLPDGVTRGSKYLGWPTEKNPADGNRRSVYVFVKRNLRYPLFEAFDFPDTHESCARRFATVNPTQPLALMNDELVRGWATALASRVLNDQGLMPEQQVERAFRIVFNRAPKDEERKTILEFLDKQAAEIGARIAKPATVTGMDPARTAAFVDLCQALLNSNEFEYVN